MYYSNKLSLLFIASPKSGSMSVQDFLMKVDPEGETHKLTIPDKNITSKDMHYGVVGHARAWEIKKAVGSDFYNKLQVMGIVRHPFDKLISTYFFNKKGNLLNAFDVKGEKRVFIRKIRGFLTYLAPKILPIGLWALIFPMKSSHEYFFDRNGQRIVKYLGRTDHLNEDLKLILKDLQISTKFEIPHINKSKHNSRHDYFKNKWIKNKLINKYKKDIDLYNQAVVEMELLQNKL